ncbi:MAG: OmpA family protein [Pseudomonadota bacterium]
MTIVKKISLLSLGGCAILSGQAALAQDEFINPDWANSAWYAGAGIGRSRATIDEPRIVASLRANGASAVAFRSDERDTAYKLFIGKQLNRYFAVEAGYFDLGKFSFDASTTPPGTIHGEVGFRGVNVDLVGQVPLSQRFSVYGRVGANYARAVADFSGNRLFAATNPHPRESKLNAKAGLGLEFKLSEALAVRGEVERYRVNDAVGNRGDIDLYSVNLVYKFGRPARTVPVVAAPPPEPVAAPEPMAAPTPKAAPLPPAPTSEKVSFSAEALFDFDKAVLKPAGKADLDSLLGKLQGMNTEAVITVGYTDSIGRAEYNRKLSVRRAESVKAYLVSKGIDASRVYTEGKGETQPVADNKTAAGRAKNRRVTVEVVGTRGK